LVEGPGGGKEGGDLCVTPPELNAVSAPQERKVEKSSEPLLPAGGGQGGMGLFLPEGWTLGGEKDVNVTGKKDGSA